MLNHFEKHWVKYITMLVLISSVLITFRLAFVNYFARHEIGFFFDTQTGELTIADRKGYHITNPFVLGYSIDSRPQQVCINANTRVLNCKLVEFNPNGLSLFVKWHGTDSYTNAELKEILKSYAYDGAKREYPFLTILKELTPTSKTYENFGDTDDGS